VACWWTLHCVLSPITQ